MRILKKPKLIAAVLLVLDMLLLAAALVVDSLRSQFDTVYTLTEDGRITASHPLDMFGIVVAAVLLVAAVLIVLFAMVVISNRHGKKMGSGIAACAVLAVFSMGVIIFSHLWVRGAKPAETYYHTYTDHTIKLIITEDDYSDDHAELSVFICNASTGELALLTVTDIVDVMNDDSRFKLDWIMDRTLRIRFPDGISYRSMQINLEDILTEEQLDRFFAQPEEHGHDHG